MGFIQHGRHVLRQIVRDTNNQSYSDRVVNPLLYACQGIRYRKLEVILTTSIDKLGKAGETVKVAPGYFRNYLMPKLLAVPNKDKFAHLIREQRKIYQPQEEEEEVVTVVTDSTEDKTKEFEKAAIRLDKQKLAFRRLINVEKARSHATKDEPLELRMPVTINDIVSEVARQIGVHVAPENVHLPSPLSTVGEYELPLRLPKSIPLPEGKVQWSLKVNIRGKFSSKIRTKVINNPENTQ
ncbi:50S ribosomal protein L9 [Quillaja saponaria]|uniref:Large ribosomal subunit protein bL9c n=1 Tax=Quillaja saponaria TaxID=32244 RepID=A0AAD7PSJ5_QUISA|nr:50S ribosomal protein L9 [Quillaja saponaria]